MSHPRERLIEIGLALACAVPLGALVAISGGVNFDSAGTSSSSASVVADAPSLIRACSADAAAASRTCRTRSATLTFAPQGELLRVGDLDARVRKVAAYGAATASGRRRRRARVVVDLQATATAGSAFGAATTAAPVYLSVAGRRIAPDRHAGGFDLDSALEAGESRSGEVRFELVGRWTDAVVRAGAELGIEPAREASGSRRIGVTKLEPMPLEPLPAG